MKIFSVKIKIDSIVETILSLCGQRQKRRKSQDQ